MVIGMDQDLIESQGRLESYIASLSEVIGHTDRVGPLGDYCHGLLLPLGRKSVEPLAAAVAPDRVSAKHQSLPHFMAKMRWRVERDDQDLKKEVGLGHYEGRGWRGFHHHATLRVAAQGFPISQRETIPPLDPDRRKDAKRLAFPKATGRAAAPIRPERHVANPIATAGRAIAVQLAPTRLRCPCCARGWKRPSRL